MATDIAQVLEAREEDDPVLDAQLSRALAPYRDLFAPEDLEPFREILAHFMTTHPVATTLLDRLRERPVRASSDTVPRRDLGALEQAVKRQKGERRGGSG